MKKGVIVKGIEAVVSFEVNLFLFRIRKITQYIRMYCVWWRFTGKKVRSKFYRSDH
jgi:hypothetical protein